MKVTIDFESRSACDIRKCGAWVYAEHSTTEVMCLAVKVDDEKPRIWVPAWLQKVVDVSSLPLLTGQDVAHIIKCADTIEAHNASFERAIWHHCFSPKNGAPPLPTEKLRCSAAKAAYHALPRSLGEACKVLGLRQQKDDTGYRVMLKLARPRRALKADKLRDPDWESRTYWNEDPEDFLVLFKYCLQDVEAEHALSEALADLPPFELALWQLDQEINARGVMTDQDMAAGMIEFVKTHVDRLQSDLIELTEGRVMTAKQNAKLKDWLNEKGVLVESVDKNAVAAALARRETPDVARQVLNIRKSLGLSSVSKYEAFLRRANDDWRVRGALLYCGAGTHRWSSIGVQLQNLPRGKFKDVEGAIAFAMDGDFDSIELFYGDPMMVASTCIRPTIIAPEGVDLIAGDFAGVEARGLAWVAGEPDVIKVFLSGKDIYVVAAQDIVGKPYDQISKDERQLGKVCVLALGYQGGIGAFSSMAKVYGVDLEALPAFILPDATQEELEAAQRNAQTYLEKNPGAMSYPAAQACDIIKQRWRAGRPGATQLWKGLEDAATCAVGNRGKVFKYRSIQYKADGRFLYCRLPSGSMIHYPSPYLREQETPWGEKKWTVGYHSTESQSGKWMRFHAYGGLLTENVVQSLCRDLMGAAMLRVEATGKYKVVLTVHDELVAEVEEGVGDVAEFEGLMAQIPPWAAGFPLAAEGWRAKRYRK